jgi:D-3-phosphoglycerate dehydrogenase
LSFSLLVISVFLGVLMKRYRVIVTEALEQEAAAWLSDAAEVIFQPYQEEETLQRVLCEADALVVRTYTRVNEALLSKAPRLRVVARAGVGLENIDLAACRARGVRVVHTPDANTQAVVEYIWALIFDALRPRPRLTGRESVEAFHRFRKECVGRQADQLCLGILGMGRIGRRIAEVGRAFGLRILYNDLLSHEALGLPPAFAHEATDKATLWASSDILTIHADGRAENRHLLDASALSQLRRDVLLLNAARGMLIDHDALAVWAKEREASQTTVILDVQDPEPLPVEHPLWRCSNVQVLPHLAARTKQAMASMSWVVRDLLRVLEGEEPFAGAV